MTWQSLVWFAFTALQYGFGLLLLVIMGRGLWRLVDWLRTRRPRPR